MVTIGVVRHNNLVIVMAEIQRPMKCSYAPSKVGPNFADLTFRSHDGGKGPIFLELPLFDLSRILARSNGSFQAVKAALARRTQPSSSQGK